MATKEPMHVIELLEQLEQLKKKKARRMQKLKVKKCVKNVKDAIDKIEDTPTNDTVSSCVENTVLPLINEENQSNISLNCNDCGSNLNSYCSTCMKCIATNSKGNVNTNLNNITTFKFNSQSSTNKVVRTKRLNKTSEKMLLTREKECRKTSNQLNTDISMDNVLNLNKVCQVDSRKLKRSITDDNDDLVKVDIGRTKKIIKLEKVLTCEIKNKLSPHVEADEGAVFSLEKREEIFNENRNSLEEPLLHGTTCFQSAIALNKNNSENIKEIASDHTLCIDDIKECFQDQESHSKSVSLNRTKIEHSDCLSLHCEQEEKRHVTLEDKVKNTETSFISNTNASNNSNDNKNDEFANVLPKVVDNNFTKTFDISSFKHIIGKDLTSALDAHYGSPNKTDTLLAVDVSANKQNLNQCPEMENNKIGLIETLENSKASSTSTSYSLGESVSLNNVDSCSIKVVNNNNEQAQPFSENSGNLFSHTENKDPLMCDSVGFSNDILEGYNGAIKNENLGDLTKDHRFDCNTLTMEVADTLEDIVYESIKKCPAVSELSSEQDTCNEVCTVPETEILETKLNKMLGCSKTLESAGKVSRSFNPPTFTINLVSKSHISSYTGAEEMVSKSTGAEEMVFESTCTVEMVSESTDAEEMVSEQSKGKKLMEESSETQCDSFLQLQTVPDTLLLDTEDSADLGSYKDIPYLESESLEDTSQNLEELPDEKASNITFLHCLHSETREGVNDVKLAYFNDSNYAFVQHVTWIEVWKQSGSKDWFRIFSHQIVNELHLKEICLAKNDNHLILVMLLSCQQGHCLQFLLFQKEAQVIKIMENIHWLQNSEPGENVFLCGLQNMKFATAKGKESFSVFVHIFRCLDDSPKLITTCLGSTVGCLQSLCMIEKLPNALLGIGHSILYVWHLQESRLVTSVALAPAEFVDIDTCIWATIENGLVFLMVVCKDEVSSRMCQLLAVNLATGFCQIYMTYSFLPSEYIKASAITNKTLKATYAEPFLAVAYDNAGFLWSVTDESCFASLHAKEEITNISIILDKNDTFTIAAGNKEGDVKCYSLKY